ncbi:MAG: hypothetical protein KDD70_13660, partial [Bdellovibrionales bacterium]|nr:hypothetical protein [Bdellovibrionales bacterium]
TTVINVQGDSPLLPPWIIQDLKNLMESREEISLGTPAIKLSREDFETLSRRYGSGEVGGTFVTVSKSGRALYFSKAPIPSIKRCRVGELPLWKHIGLYAYRKEMLLKFVELDPTPLEVVEQLEQLRALENDIDIHVIAVDYRGRTAHSVDNPSDIQIVEAIVEREGELV